ncbi:MAG: molybdopterin oxidoreductase [Epsilonproteobacteria bacterium]|nr:MAG: molybdopterin oxidoreductase [Campylobacterota bacterium]
MIKTACGLDCPDACSILVDPAQFPKLIADTNNGALCSLLNKELFDASRITSPRINGKEVSIEEALDAVAQSLTKKSLLWRGSGNFGVMQEITDLLFDKINGTLTRGSLCDGAGDAGIIEGRGVNRTLPLEQIEKADVVVVWGRNPTTTNTHIMPYLKEKKIIVIDPVRTALAKKADLHVQIKPRSDFYLAVMLARFTFMENVERKEWLDEFAPDYEDYEDFTREFRIKAILEYMGLDLNDMGELLSYLHQERVVILVGNGVQKYSTGHYVLQAIDSLAAVLGLFGREGCGVGYLGNSKLGFDNPFTTKCQHVPKAATPFGDYDTVLVQGGNPAESMPDTVRVDAQLKSVETLIYFGLYENATSRQAKIIIPAKNFFEKEDIRLSYGDHEVRRMNKAIESEIGISEYDFCQRLFGKLGFEGLEEETTYLNQWLNQCEKQDGHYRSPAYEPHPYHEGFGEDGGEDFVFVEDFNDDFQNIKQLKKYRKLNKNKITKEEFWLLTPKAKHALNTQFRRGNQVEIHPDLGFVDGEKVIVSSSHGSHEFIICNNRDLRDDCVMITSNVIGVNHLTPSVVSEEGDNACYQEVKVVVGRRALSPMIV